MNDYKDLIDNLKYLADTVRYPIINELHAGSLMEDAADAIEQLVKELDAAVEQMRGNCKYCKNNFESAKYCISNCDENLSAWEWVGIDGNT